MASTLTVVLDEFLRLGAAQARKNSLTALSVIDSEESAKLIAKTALQDEDTSVRQRAVDEMMSLSANQRKTALDVLANGLTSDDQHHQQRAYSILGKFKSMGWEVPKTRMKWGNRMWLASSLYSSIYPQRSWWFRVRSWKPALLATAISTLPFLVFNYQSSMFITAQGILLNVLLVAVISLAGVLLSVFATQFATPIYLQLRPFAAAIIQVLAAFICTFLAGLAGIILLLVMLGGNRDYEVLTWLLFILLLSSMVAAIRVGTLLPLLRMQFVRISRNRKFNWFIETAAGTIAGFFVATLVYRSYWSDLVGLDYDYGYGYINQKRLNEYTAIWLAFLAIIIGLAYSFAKIDTEVLSDHRTSNSTARDENETSNE